jgi:hypothetical protein
MSGSVIQIENLSFYFRFSALKLYLDTSIGRGIVASSLHIYLTANANCRSVVV